MQPLLDAIVALRPVARRAAGAGRRRETGDDVDVAAADSGPASAFIWKTVADPFAGRITMFRVVTGRAEGGLDRPERHAATRRSGSATSCCCRERRRRRCPEIKAGDLGAVAKLKDTPDERPARRQGAGVHAAADQVPRAGALVRDRAEEPRRRREDQHGAAPAAGGGPDHQLHPRSRRRRNCCSPARVSRTSR